VTDQAVLDLAPLVGTVAACTAAGRARATHYRRHRQSAPAQRAAPVAHIDRVQPAALTSGERAEVLAVLHSERFCDAAPAQVWATLLDENVYLASESTFYRLLRGVHGDVRDRRAQATHPAKVKPELVAHGPNQVWSWDITKLHGPAKWTYFYLYAVIDVYSRMTVGWMVATRESAKLAESLLAQTITAENVPAKQLTIHADRGSSMASKPVALLLADLGVINSHSRPPGQQRQPLQRVAVQDPQVLPELPRHLRLARGRPGVLRRVLPRLQQPSPPRRPGTAHPRRRARRPGPGRAGQARPDPRRRARPARQPVPAPTAATRLPEPAWINRPADKEDDTQKSQDQLPRTG